MEHAVKFRMRKYSKQTGTHTYAVPMRGINESKKKDKA